MSLTSQTHQTSKNEVIQVEEVDETIEEEDESDILTNQSQILMPSQNIEMPEEEFKTVANLEGGFEVIAKPATKR